MFSAKVYEIDPVVKIRVLQDQSGKLTEYHLGTWTLEEAEELVEKLKKEIARAKAVRIALEAVS